MDASVGGGGRPGAGGGSGGEGGGGAGEKNNKSGKKKGGAFATPSRRDCANCGQPEGTVPGILQHKPCGKCKITFYCSTECQKKHWKGGHKKHCKTPEERSVAKAQAEAAASSSPAAAASSIDMSGTPQSALQPGRRSCPRHQSGRQTRTPLAVFAAS